ncbi:MAG: histone deacetylase [Paenibacillaceae bacterium ZCTH02-B3]|nr:MAG: histone deacetylase [Paenibacillaceae bacterium ZCTH02-B3]
MNDRAVWIDTSASRKYIFHDRHPFHPVRLELTEGLLKAAGAWPERLVPSDFPGAEDALALVHRPDYIRAVQRLGSGGPVLTAVDPAMYGLDPHGDTPYFPGMHEAALGVVAGTLRAAAEVMSGRADHALHLGGGLHHAFPERASGFCVYNDVAVAIAWIRREYDARVLYVDTDVHHGDGVQWRFYTDPDVFTFSIHETGKYLFPGTGFPHERGESAGYGACLNVPLEPYTEDDSWLECFTAALERITRAFRPDVIVSQHGCDAHAFDPLAHIHCSMRIFREIPRLIHQLAHAFCGGRWIAAGGGGYDHWRVVPRAWSLLWMEMCDHPLLKDIDRSERERPALLPESWAAFKSPRRPGDMPAAWMDDTSRWQPIPRRPLIDAKNKDVLEVALQHVG